MNCGDCAERLDEYLDAALPDDVRAGVEAHLAACGACLAELHACRSLAESLKSLPRPVPGAEVCMRVSAAIHGEGQAPVRTEYGPVLDVDELCDFLRVDKSTLELYLSDIPSFELGGRLLFRRIKVEEWIARRERTAGFRSDRMAGDWTLRTGRRKPWTLSQRN